MLDLLKRIFPDAAITAPVRLRRQPRVTVTRQCLAPVIEAVTPGETVTLVVSDQTRKTGADLVLTVLIDAWRAQGVTDDRLSFLIACGSHRSPDAAEIARILGPGLAADFANRIRCHNAFSSHCVRLGTTRRGTPVEVNRLALEPAALIPIGGVTFHYFAGFTGGRKSVVPGLASAHTIAANHSLSMDPAAGTFRAGVETGRLAGNPLAEDLAEAAALVRVRASVQTVLDGEGRITGLFAGEMNSAHAAACGAARDSYSFPLAETFDLVVAGAGPARNWVQSHKALVNSRRAAGQEGLVILEAPCPEGLGSESLERWLDKGSPAAIMAGIAESADINAQTALSTLLRGRKTILVTTLHPTVVAGMGMTRAESLEEALRLAAVRLAGIPRQLRILPLPEAWLTVPV